MNAVPTMTSVEADALAPALTSVKAPTIAPISTPVVASAIEKHEKHEKHWPSLSAKFADIMNSEGGIRSIRNNLTERANQSKRKKDEIDSMRVRGPVTLVLAGLRSVSRVLAIPLTALDSTEEAVSGIETLGWRAKLAHSIVFLICMVLVYVVYTSLMFTTVTDANTFVITTTMAWILCLWLILWLAL